MPMDFTIIQPVRQRFGDDSPDLDVPVELEAPFVGPAKDFAFACPDVDPGQMAILQFETLGVGADSVWGRNILRINGLDIPGGITPGPYVTPRDARRQYFWKAHSLLVPSHVLRPENVLHIESVLHQHGPGTSLDNFIVDNIVLFYKTRRLVHWDPSRGIPDLHPT